MRICKQAREAGGPRFLTKMHVHFHDVFGRRDVKIFALVETRKSREMKVLFSPTSCTELSSSGFCGITNASLARGIRL